MWYQSNLEEFKAHQVHSKDHKILESKPYQLKFWLQDGSIIPFAQLSDIYKFSGQVN